MRDKLIRVLQAVVLLAVVASFAHAGAGDLLYIKHKATSGTCADPSSSYALWENFSGANADNNSYSGFNQTGWLSSGPYSINTTPVLDSGSGCQNALRIDNEAVILHTFTASDNASAHFLFRFSGLPAANEDVFVVSSGATAKAKVTLKTTGAIQCTHGSSIMTATVGAMSAGANYHIWIDYARGTGADGVGSCGFSTDGTKPSSGDNHTSIANGNGATTVDTAKPFISTATISVYYDKIRVMTGLNVIGSNPD